MKQSEELESIRAENKPEGKTEFREHENRPLEESEENMVGQETEVLEVGN